MILIIPEIFGELHLEFAWKPCHLVNLTNGAELLITRLVLALQKLSLCHLARGFFVRIVEFFRTENEILRLNQRAEKL